MTRLSGRRRTDALNVLNCLQCTYGHDPFNAALAYRQAVTLRNSPFAAWSLSHFTECLDLLVAHRFLELQDSPEEAKTYAIPRTMAKRKNAVGTLTHAIEAVKQATTDRPASVRQIEESGQKAQMIRSAIDILLGLGVVTATRTPSSTEIMWDLDQEDVLKNTEDGTKEYWELTNDIADLENEIARLNEQLRGLEMDPMSSPREPPTFDRVWLQAY
jgi:hypothetical protein